MKKLISSIENENLAIYLSNQLNNFFPDSNKINFKLIIPIVQNAIKKIEICFSKIKLPYYNSGINTYFNHLNGDHYCSFLYQVSRIAFLDDNLNLATKTFLLNKSLFGIDLFYTVELPKYTINQVSEDH